MAAGPEEASCQVFLLICLIRCYRDRQQYIFLQFCCQEPDFETIYPVLSGNSTITCWTKTAVFSKAWEGKNG